MIERNRITVVFFSFYSSGAHLSCSHFHSAVATTRSRRLFGHRFCSNDLNAKANMFFLKENFRKSNFDEISVVNFFKSDEKVNNNVSTTRNVGVLGISRSAAKRKEVAEKAENKTRQKYFRFEFSLIFHLENGSWNPLSWPCCFKPSSPCLS